MRLFAACVCAVIGVGLSSCGSSGSGSGSVTPPDAGVGAGVDAGTGAGGTDAGVTDAGVTDAGTGGGGADAGTIASDCDGLLPPSPGAPSQFRWEKQDLSQTSGGTCKPAESDGTGHIALYWQNSFQPGDSRYRFIDSSTGAAVGSYTGTGLRLIGQASGFIGSECAGAACFQDYVVLDPAGKQLYKSPVTQSGGAQANDPTGGMVHVRYSQSSAGTIVLLDAIDAAGAIRWTRSLPDLFPRKPGVALGVDRKGDVLALWPGNQTPPATYSGQWFDRFGTAGPVFQALSGTSPAKFFERVGDGLFLAGGPSASGWLGQFEPLATSISPPPAWLTAHPNSSLHIVHGGRGYAVLPLPGTSPSCQQAVDVISPSGKTCGSSTFPVGGGSCATSSIVVGYDGTVVQQLPREREAACIAADHICDCTYRYWAGYFR